MYEIDTFNQHTENFIINVKINDRFQQFEVDSEAGQTRGNKNTIPLIHGWYFRTYWSGRTVFKARKVLHASKKKVEEKLDGIESKDIISKVQKVTWLYPLVVIRRADGTVRLWVVYKELI